MDVIPEVWHNAKSLAVDWNSTMEEDVSWDRDFGHKLVCCLGYIHILC